MVRIHTVRALTDNYCYVVHREGSDCALVIDPSEAPPIEKFLNAHGLKLGLILNTHHHHDHVDGNLDLAAATGAPVYCSQVDFSRVPGAVRGFKDGETFKFDEMDFKVLSIPGHTRGQIAFLNEAAHALFVGDTIFAMGCGRLFEESPAVMLQSLQKILKLEPRTKIYFGHEYTETNAQFASQLDPHNSGIASRLQRTREQIAKHGSAEAPTLADESKINPFLIAAGAGDLERFAKIREMRNVFKPA